MMSLEVDRMTLLVGSGAALATAFVGYWLGRRSLKKSTSLKASRNDSKVIQYTVENSLRLDLIQQRLREETEKHVRYRMLGASEQLQFLANLCRCINAKKTLDIGVYTGYSAMSIAMALPEDGVVVALDISSDYPEIGRPYWQKAGQEKKIDLRIGPAKDSLEALVAAGEEGTFDFAFIDADKEGYDAYYEFCLKLLRPGGIIALDNMLWGASVLDPQTKDPSTRALQAITKKIHGDARVDVSFLYLGDGTLLAFKRGITNNNSL